MATWQLVDGVPFGFGLPVTVNGTDIVLTERRNEGFKTLYKYDSSTQEWSAFLPHPQNVKLYDQAFCYDEQQRVIYICTYYGDIIAYDLNMNTSTLYKNNQQTIAKFGSDPSAVAINGKLHVIGGYQNRQHLIWDAQSNTFAVEHTFDANELGSGFFDMKLLYLKRRQWILMMAMQCVGHEAGKNVTDLIYCYSLQDRKWRIFEQLTLPRVMYGFGAVVTKDERYLIVFGGMFAYKEQYDDIYVADLDGGSWRRVESLKSPKKGACHAVLVGDSVRAQELVIGYIKQCWRDTEFVGIQALPHELAQMIRLFYVDECVHLFADAKQWKINMNDILG